MMSDHTLPNRPQENTLACVPFFAELPSGVISEITELATPHYFEADQVIYLEGEPAEVMYILTKGWIKATRMSPEGREQAMQFLRPCQIFGDIAVWLGGNYPCTVVALEPAEVWSLEKTAIFDLMHRHPELGMVIIQRLAQRVMHYITMVEDLSLRSVEARLAKTLLQHAENSEEGMYVPRRDWTTYDEMATRLGTVRDVLSRALHNLQDEGLLRVDRNAIWILDPESLNKRGEA
jgi:CRP-like cAMP-binding protein